MNDDMSKIHMYPSEIKARTYVHFIGDRRGTAYKGYYRNVTCIILALTPAFCMSTADMTCEIERSERIRKASHVLHGWKSEF